MQEGMELELMEETWESLFWRLSRRCRGQSLPGVEFLFVMHRKDFM